MRIEQLRYFAEAVQQRSIHKASEKLHISHQSLNASLKSMEQELDIVLLSRSTQGVSPTAAGEVLLQYALDVLQRTARMESDLAALRAPQDVPLTGSLNCLVSPNLALQVLPQMIKNFSAAYPAVTLNIKERDSKQIISRLLDGYEGLAFVTYYQNDEQLPPASDRLIINPLFTETDYAAVSVNHPLAAYKRVSIKTLLKYPVALYQNDDDGTCITLDMLKKAGSPQVYMISDNIRILEDAAIAGQAVTFAPQRAVKHRTIFAHTNQIAFLTITDYPPLIVSFMLSKAYYQSNQAVVDRFIEIFAEIW